MNSYAKDTLIKNGGQNNGASRNHLLDLVKGVAIVLVVIGHTIQGNVRNFDDNYGFRFIYSFHMPLFALLAGASSAYWIKGYKSIRTSRELIDFTIRRFKRAVGHLLVPFFLWSTIGFILSDRKESLAEYYWTVLLRPDLSLWFLPCIFWCTIFIAIFMSIKTALKLNESLNDMGWPSIVLRSSVAQWFLLFIVWRLLSRTLPAWGGLYFSNDFHGGLFLFFLIGCMFFGAFTEVESKPFRMAQYLIFFGLVLYWSRIAPNNIVTDAPIILAQSGLAGYYALIVAISGSLVAIDFSKIVYLVGFERVNGVLEYLGRSSLGIYAAHFYFLNVFPLVISPIILSLIFCRIVSLNKVAKKLLLGG